ncbi:uncharacterized protein [Drosophila pseudoobscura]|uniref:Uncharacterized protein n=1 Tax=Drosophila pseudoobscura pseudoobscura TaxID=46245 RepID=A0A6I8VZD7_DROPS|nr:uncharacterized protein LOC26532452 [Drosophila pseudoobscura]XP_033236432.1 uncharacterized protein LOC26532452 [Drosophila pseudoobscura]
MPTRYILFPSEVAMPKRQDTSGDCLAVADESIRVGRRRPNIIDHGMRPKLGKLPIGQDVNRTRYRLTEDEQTMWVTTDSEVIGVQKKYIQKMGIDMDNYFNPKFPSKENKNRGNTKTKVSKPPKLPTIPEEPEEESIGSMELWNSTKLLNAVAEQSGSQTAFNVRECLMNPTTASKWSRKSLRRLQEAAGLDTVKPVDSPKNLQRLGPGTGAGTGASSYKSRKEIGVRKKKKTPLTSKEKLMKERAERMEMEINDLKKSQTEAKAKEPLPNNSTYSLGESHQNDPKSAFVGDEKPSSSSENNNLAKDLTVIYENPNFIQKTDSKGNCVIKKLNQSKTNYFELKDTRSKVEHNSKELAVIELKSEAEKSLLRSCLVQNEDTLKAIQSSLKLVKELRQELEGLKTNRSIKFFDISIPKGTIRLLVTASFIINMTVLLLALLVYVRLLFREPATPTYWQFIQKYLTKK